MTEGRTIILSKGSLKIKKASLNSKPKDKTKRIKRWGK